MFRRSDIANRSFYHGTSFENLPGIFEKGLIPQTPHTNGYGDDRSHLFLTPSMEKAARYAFTFDDPVILKVTISTPDRLRNLQTDEYDDPRAQDPHHGMEMAREGPLSSIRDKLRHLAREKGWSFLQEEDPLPVYEGHSRSFETEVAKTNFYRAMKSYLSEAFDDKNQSDNAYRLIKNTFKPGQYGDVHILDNGDLQLDEHYWEDQHQVKYPDRLPPAAIKEAWIEQSTFNEHIGDPESEGSTSKKVRVPHLPSEKKEIDDRLDDLDDFFRFRLSNLFEEEGKKAVIQEARDKMRGYQTSDFPGSSGPAELMEDFIDWLQEGEEISQDEIERWSYKFTRDLFDSPYVRFVKYPVSQLEKEVGSQKSSSIRNLSPSKVVSRYLKKS